MAEIDAARVTEGPYMTTAQGALVVAIVVGIFIPTIVALVRMTVKFTKVEDSLSEVTKRLDTIIKDKDQAHLELATAIREDRAATDRRLRWLEEHLWKTGGGPDAVRRTGR